jgi:hypothetical protein
MIKIFKKPIKPINQPSQSSGFTLIELLISSIIFLTVIGVAVQTFSIVGSSQSKIVVSTNLQQATRFTMEAIVRDVKNANSIGMVEEGSGAVVTLYGFGLIQGRAINNACSSNSTVFIQKDYSLLPQCNIGLIIFLRENNSNTVRYKIYKRQEIDTGDSRLQLVVAQGDYSGTPIDLTDFINVDETNVGIFEPLAPNYQQVLDGEATLEATRQWDLKGIYGYGSGSTGEIARDDRQPFFEIGLTLAEISDEGRLCLNNPSGGGGNFANCSIDNYHLETTVTPRNYLLEENK